MTLASAVHLCRACDRPCVPGAGSPWSVRYQCQRCGVTVPIEGPAQYGPDPPRLIPRPGGRVPWADLVDPGPVRSRERSHAVEARP